MKQADQLWIEMVLADPHLYSQEQVDEAHNMRRWLIIVGSWEDPTMKKERPLKREGGLGEIAEFNKVLLDEQLGEVE